MALVTAVLGNEELAKLLGKRGTKSDITLYNRKHKGESYAFVYPSSYPDKLSSLLHAVNMESSAILHVDSLTPELGETIVALDSLGVEQGLLVLENIPEEEFRRIVRGTVVENYEPVEKDFGEIFSRLERFSSKDLGFPVVEIDHFFDVKSVGTVALGVVRGGAIEKYQKLELYPLGKEVMIKSIQIHDEDVQEAKAGDRVGLALKGVEVSELKRGYLLAETGRFQVVEEFEAGYEKVEFFKGELNPGAKAMVSFGMRYEACTIKDLKDESVLIKSEKPLAIYKGVGLIARPEVKGLRIAGRIKVEI